MANSDVNSEAVATGAAANPAPFDIWDNDVLSDLVASIAQPRPYAEVEALEVWIKNSWNEAGVTALDARTRARFSEFFLRIGLIPKYKSYGVKYAAPFGYSLFDLENGEGFSIQLHETAKVEAFHVLSTKTDSLVLLCTEAEWQEHGDEFVKLWEDGQASESLIAYRPEPGDVAVIEDLSTIHTVLGCVVEEFATTSYDNVKRLYDQNKDRPVNLPSAHKPVAEVLKEASSLDPARRVRRNGGDWKFETVTVPANADISRLPDMGLVGRHVTLQGTDAVSETVATELVTTVFVLGGTAQIDVDGTKFELNAGDSTALAPGTTFAITTSATASLSICEVLAEYGFADLR